jgi:hypothetical protein
MHKPETHIRGFGRSPNRLINESYSVKDEFVSDIVARFVVTPERDAFATEGNRRFPKWWGPGSPDGRDAFDQSWGGPLLWMNPPYSRLKEVMAKIKRDEAHAILVLPAWSRRRFYLMAKGLSLGEIRYPAETRFFEMPAGQRKGRRTPWPVTAFFVCGHQQLCNPMTPGPLTQQVRILLPRKVQWGFEKNAAKATLQDGAGGEGRRRLDKSEGSKGTHPNSTLRKPGA